MSGRYIYGKGTQNFPLTSGNGSPLPEYQTVVPTKIQLFGLNFSQIVSPTLFNEARISYNRFEQTFTPLDADFDPSSLGLGDGFGRKFFADDYGFGLSQFGCADQCSTRAHQQCVSTC